MHRPIPFRGPRQDRYSAKRMEKPVNFVCNAPEAKEVYVVGDFNQWQVGAHSMEKRPDGIWFASIPLHHGHHRYVFVIDGVAFLDPQAQGVTRNEHDERVSLVSVS